MVLRAVREGGRVITEDMLRRLPPRLCERVGEHGEHTHGVAPYVCDGLGLTDAAFAIREAKEAARMASERGLTAAKAATEDATARTSPGEGDGTGSGPGETHGAAEGLATGGVYTGPPIVFEEPAPFIHWPRQNGKTVVSEHINALQTRIAELERQRDAALALCELPDIRLNDTVGAYAVDLAQEIRKIYRGGE